MEGCDQEKRKDGAERERIKKRKALASDAADKRHVLQEGTRHSHWTAVQK